ncbi:MAG: hypothetical protein HC888_14060 [Candidatus Competibacteraceae bacterium]|nr:hypothetical protein [Candidatus Competibacteraceae bacterium]
MLTDITTRKQHESNMLRAKQEAEAANLAKARFLASASHELRHPVQAALLFAELLEDHTATDGGRELVSRLVETLEGMRTLLDSVLDLSRLSAGAVRPEPTEFAVGDLLEALAEIYRPRAEAQGLRFRYVPCGLTVVCDYELLRPSARARD